MASRRGREQRRNAGNGDEGLGGERREHHRPMIGIPLETPYGSSWRFRIGFKGNELSIYQKCLQTHNARG